MRQLTLTLLLLMAAAPAQAEQSVAHRPTVGEMYEKCRAAAVVGIEELPPERFVDAISCIGLLRGFVDGLDIGGRICREEKPGSQAYLRLTFLYLTQASKLMLEDETVKDRDWMLPMFRALGDDGWLCPGAVEQMYESLQERMRQNNE